MSCSHSTYNPNNTGSPLLRLSRELHDKIWSYLDTVPNTIPLAVENSYDNKYNIKIQFLSLEKGRASTVSSTDFQGLSILYVCCQINTEASELLLFRNVWSNDHALHIFARRLCHCKVAKIRHIQLSMRTPWPWNTLIDAIQTFTGLQLVVSEMSTNTIWYTLSVNNQYIAQQMENRWTWHVDAMDGSALKRVYVRSDLQRLPLKDGTEGPITSILRGERIVLNNARGLGNGFNYELFRGKGIELDIRKEKRYWQNWERIDEEAYNLEVEEADAQREGDNPQADYVRL